MPDLILNPLLLCTPNVSQLYFGMKNVSSISTRTLCMIILYTAYRKSLHPFFRFRWNKNKKRIPLILHSIPQITKQKQNVFVFIKWHLWPGQPERSLAWEVTKNLVTLAELQKSCVVMGETSRRSTITAATALLAWASWVHGFMSSRWKWL